MSNQIITELTLNNNLLHKFHHVFHEEESKVYARGNLIYMPNKDSEQVFFVEEGAVKIYKHYGAKTFLKYFIFDHEIFGLEGVIGEEQYFNFAEVISLKCKLKALNAIKLCHSIGNDPELAKSILQVLQSRETITYHRFQDKIQKSTEQIIIGLIMEIGRRTGVIRDDGIHIPFMPVQGDMATYLGVSRQNVSTTLAKLKKENSITYTRSSFIIREPEALML